MIYKLLNWLLYRATANLVMWRTDWQDFLNEHAHAMRVMVAHPGEVVLLRLADGRWACGVAYRIGKKVA